MTPPGPRSSVTLGSTQVVQPEQVHGPGTGGYLDTVQWIWVLCLSIKSILTLKFSQYIILCLTSYLKEIVSKRREFSKLLEHVYLMRFKYLPPGEWRILDLLYFWHVFWTSCFLNFILFWIDCISLFVRNEYWLIWEEFAWYNLDILNIVARNMVTEISDTNDKNLTNILKLHFIVHCWHLNMIILTLTHMTFVDQYDPWSFQKI